MEDGAAEVIERLQKEELYTADEPNPLDDAPEGWLTAVVDLRVAAVSLALWSELGDRSELGRETLALCLNLDGVCARALISPNDASRVHIALGGVAGAFDRWAVPSLRPSTSSGLVEFLQLGQEQARAQLRLNQRIAPSIILPGHMLVISATVGDAIRRGHGWRCSDSNTVPPLATDGSGSPFAAPPTHLALKLELELPGGAEGKDSEHGDAVELAARLKAVGVLAQLHGGELHCSRAVWEAFAAFVAPMERQFMLLPQAASVRRERRSPPPTTTTTTTHTHTHPHTGCHLLEYVVIAVLKMIASQSPAPWWFVEQLLTTILTGLGVSLEAMLPMRLTVDNSHHLFVSVVPMSSVASADSTTAASMDTDSPFLLEARRAFTNGPAAHFRIGKHPLSPEHPILPESDSTAQSRKFRLRSAERLPPLRFCSTPSVSSNVSTLDNAQNLCATAVAASLGWTLELYDGGQVTLSSDRLERPGEVHERGPHRMPSTWNVERIFDAGGPAMPAIGAYAVVKTVQTDASELAASGLPSAPRDDLSSSTAAKDGAQPRRAARFSSLLVVLTIKPPTKLRIANVTQDSKSRYQAGIMR
eukprot:7383651-Prymnesium_polylepis.1